MSDKSTNLYEMNSADYKRLLNNNITKSYKKSNIDLKANINSEAWDIATSLSLEDRVECISKKDAFNTLKDQKANFKTSPSCWLINPLKKRDGTRQQSLIRRHCERSYQKIRTQSMEEHFISNWLIPRYTPEISSPPGKIWHMWLLPLNNRRSYCQINWVCT